MLIRRWGIGIGVGNAKIWRWGRSGWAPWVLVGRALWAMGACGPGPCGPPGPLLAGPLWAPWALVGWALMAPLGPYGLGLDGHPSQLKVRFYGELAEPFGHP